MGSSRHFLEDALGQVVVALRVIGDKRILEKQTTDVYGGRREKFFDNPRTADTDRIFAVLCEHIILAGAGGARIVKNPATILEVRENFLFHEAAEALENLVLKGLIKGAPPWQTIQIVPEVPAPEHGAYRSGISRGRKRKMEHEEAGLILPARQGPSGLSRTNFIPRREPRKIDFGGRFFPHQRSGGSRFRNIQNRRAYNLTFSEVYKLLLSRASAISGERIVRGAIPILERHFQIGPSLAMNILESFNRKRYLTGCDDWRSIVLCADAINEDALIL